MVFKVTRPLINRVIRIISNVDTTQNSLDEVYAKYTDQHLTNE